MGTKRDAVGGGIGARGAVSLSVFSALMAAAIVACGDAGGVNELSGLPGGGSNGQPGPAPGGAFTSNNGGSGDGGIAPAGPSQAELLFNALQPQLSQSCGGACHAQGAGGAPAFLAPPDVYKSVAQHKGIIVKDVATSSILNKGRHEGPDLVDPLRGQVFAWLTEEAKALASVTLPTTDPFNVALGANSIDISKGGTNVAGTKLTFNASFNNDVVTLSNIQVVAPATSAVHVVFPIFVVISPDGSEHADDSFSNADQTIPSGQAVTLNPGILILTGWQLQSKLRIEFTKLEQGVTQSDAGGGSVNGGGCKSVASFSANAKPAIQQNGCLNCHNSGGSGNGALDLSALAKGDDATACAQAKVRIDTNNPAQSDIILAPTGGVAAHPFKNAQSTYASMMQAWIVNEK